MTEVRGSITMPKFDGVNAVGVYTGSVALEGLVFANHRLNWRKDEEATRMTGVDYYELTLDEIAEQLGQNGAMITVFFEGPLDGVIYQYGNYGDGKWYKAGTLYGYA